jgi:hypothetical protein
VPLENHLTWRLKFSIWPRRHGECGLQNHKGDFGSHGGVMVSSIVALRISAGCDGVE